MVRRFLIFASKAGLVRAIASLEGLFLLGISNPIYHSTFATNFSSVGVAKEIAVPNVRPFPFDRSDGHSFRSLVENHS
ncbi:hypothetical protein ET33_27025 [Paenibacillus tyrfis]|uniref:Uncharacterized protein n=1 Tax=Paenibacillus tyrfis TaxID=1501230 RepID=A0A081NUW1_9BACL|nr:hypothetical protein ET33_27025 [Paenibacillus tyrfis]